jgi:UDP-N-acetylmuramoyl-L-alanyl-D-glutamate--2,6-diaminopimelate ligase
MEALKTLVKQIMPKSLLNQIRPYGHGFLAYVAAWQSGFPSRKLTVIGVTGTAGKSSTVQMLATILNFSGRKTGFITTVGSFDGDNEKINKQGLSMPGGAVIQKKLFEMIANGCSHTIIEATSEGLAQNRHLGIDFDMALITNLAPAHLEAHGGFVNYKKSKGRLFRALEKSAHKSFVNKKVIGVALPNEYSEYFLKFSADKKFIVKVVNKSQGYRPENNGVKEYVAFTSSEPGHFEIDDQDFQMNLPGDFNIRNAVFAACAAHELGVSFEESATALQGISEITGRMQKIPNDRHFEIFIDYAPEPIAMQNALEAVASLPHNRIIHVFGSTGGHRDIQKRFEFGKISARFADIIIVTNDDVYDSDPQKIADDVVTGIRRSDAVPYVHVILDRREAIKRALSLAMPGDTVIFTGKGSEQFLVLPGDERISWDEKVEIQKALNNL